MRRRTYCAMAWIKKKLFSTMGGLCRHVARTGTWQLRHVVLHAWMPSTEAFTPTGQHHKLQNHTLATSEAELRQAAASEGGTA